MISDLNSLHVQEDAFSDTWNNFLQFVNSSL